MLLNILFSGRKLGVMPATELLQGSTELGDVLNSFATFVQKSIRQNPDHPLTVLYRVMPKSINDLVVLADSFEIKSTPSLESDFDGVVTFKGKEYYVLDYDTTDAQRTEVRLDLRLKSLVEAEASLFDTESAAEDTLTLLLEAVGSYLNDALLEDTERRNLPKAETPKAAAPATWEVPALHRGIVVAAPALPTPPKADGIAAPALPSIPKADGIAYSVPTATVPRQTVTDVDAARAALSALLRKGHL